MKKAMMLMVALFVSFPLYANCGNGGDNGNGCSGDDGGKQGPAGPQGPAGKDGANGTDADTGPKRSLQGEVDVRIWDTKRTSFYLFNSYGFDDSPDHDTLMDGRNATYGCKLIIKLGTSYEERLIQDLEHKLKEQRRLMDTFTTSTTKGK